MDINHYMVNMQKVLYMAAVLHTRGYEKLHVIPSLSPSGLSWRCAYMTMDAEPVIVSNWIYQQFDVNAASEIDVLELADRFEREHFDFLRTCLGSDSRYVEWYRRMLEVLEEEELPYALSDYFSPYEYWQTSCNKRILTLPDENRFLDNMLNGKKEPIEHERKIDIKKHIEPETLSISNFDYTSAIIALNYANCWMQKHILLVVKQEQYLAMLKGYQLHWDMRFGLLYDQNNDYFYVYRSGYVLGKYKLELDEDRYYCSEAYENRYKPDIMVIYECVKEACRQNGLHYDPEYFSEHAEETLHENSLRVQSHTPDLGPQSPSDNSFTAKARKLQSLWRVQNGLEMGVGPNKNSTDRKTRLPTYYGNMIKDGKTTGRNFFYPETFAYARWRVDTKLKDETIDEYRLFNNLMSSMPMAFNLFHPLMMLHAQNPAVVDRMLQKAFPGYPIYKVKEIGLEFIPTPIERYTNDKSAMDAFVRFYDKEGGEYIIAIETKYTDSLGINTAKDDNLKIQFAIESELFTDEGISRIKTNCTQIYRNFLLTEKYRAVHGLKGSYSIIIAPKDHPTTDYEIKSLKNFLKGTYSYKLIEYKLEEFIIALKLNCPIENLDWLEWFDDRYLNI